MTVAQKLALEQSSRINLGEFLSTHGDLRISDLARLSDLDKLIRAAQPGETITLVAEEEEDSNPPGTPSFDANGVLKIPATERQKQSPRGRSGMRTVERIDTEGCTVSISENRSVQVCFHHLYSHTKEHLAIHQPYTSDDSYIGTDCNIVLLVPEKPAISCSGWCTLHRTDRHYKDLWYGRAVTYARALAKLSTLLNVRTPTFVPIVPKSVQEQINEWKAMNSQLAKPKAESDMPKFSRIEGASVFEQVEQWERKHGKAAKGWLADKKVIREALIAANLIRPSQEKPATSEAAPAGVTAATSSTATEQTKIPNTREGKDAAYFQAFAANPRITMADLTRYLEERNFPFSYGDPYMEVREWMKKHEAITKSIQGPGRSKLYSLKRPRG